MVGFVGQQQWRVVGKLLPAGKGRWHLVGLVSDTHAVLTQQDLTHFIKYLVNQAADANEIRDDISPRELADYCIHAIGAARRHTSKAAVHRLISIILDELCTDES